MPIEVKVLINVPLEKAVSESGHEAHHTRATDEESNATYEEQIFPHTISDERLQAFIKRPTPGALSGLIYEVFDKLGKEYTHITFNKAHVAQELVLAFINEANKKPREQQDFIVALIKALTSETPSTQLHRIFSELRDCYILLSLLNTKAYEPQQQLILQKLTMGHLIYLSGKITYEDIIKLLKVLPAAQQEQYLTKLYAADSTRFRETFSKLRTTSIYKSDSELRHYVQLIASLKAKSNAPQQQLFKEVLSVDYLLSISAAAKAAKDTDIIDLIQVLPAAQQQEYLDKLDADHLRAVLNDGFTLHGVLDSLADSKAKRNLIDRLGINHIRATILSVSEEPEEPEEQGRGYMAPVISDQQLIIQNFVALLRGFKTEEDFNYILKQLGTEFLLTILYDTESLSYFFQQINTDKQRLMLNMLGGDNLKKLLTPKSTEQSEVLSEENAATQKYDQAKVVSNNLLALLKSLNPANYTIILSLLGQDWFRKNQLSKPLAELIEGFDHKTITALLPFIVTSETITTLVNFAFSCDLEAIRLENEQLLVENAAPKTIHPYNLLGHLPLVTLLWQSLKSDESKKWIQANHSLLNQLLVANLQRWQSGKKTIKYTTKDWKSSDEDDPYNAEEWQTETTIFNQKYYLSTLANEGVLADCVTTTAELINTLKHLHKDAQITFLKGLGQKHLSSLLVSKPSRTEALSCLDLNNQHLLNSMLKSQQRWQYVKIAGVALAITAGVTAFAYVAIPGAAAVITAWTTSILVIVQSFANAVIAYSLHAAQYVMNLCYALVNTALISAQAHQGLVFIGAVLAGVVGLAYLWRNKDSKPAVATKEARVKQAAYKEHIILEEAKKAPRSALSNSRGKGALVNPEFVAAAKASLVSEQVEQAVAKPTQHSHGALVSPAAAAPPVFVPPLRLDTASAAELSQHRMRQDGATGGGDSRLDTRYRATAASSHFAGVTHEQLMPPPGTASESHRPHAQRPMGSEVGTSTFGPLPPPAARHQSTVRGGGAGGPSRTMTTGWSLDQQPLMPSRLAPGAAPLSLPPGVQVDSSYPGVHPSGAHGLSATLGPDDLRAVGDSRSAPPRVGGRFGGRGW